MLKWWIMRFLNRIWTQFAVAGSTVVTSRHKTKFQFDFIVVDRFIVIIDIVGTRSCFGLCFNWQWFRLHQFIVWNLFRNNIIVIKVLFFLQLCVANLCVVRVYCFIAWKRFKNAFIFIGVRFFHQFHVSDFGAVGSGQEFWLRQQYHFVARLVVVVRARVFLQLHVSDFGAMMRWKRDHCIRLNLFRISIWAERDFVPVQMFKFCHFAFFANYK